MKKSKKILGLVLSIILIFSFVTPVLAVTDSYHADIRGHWAEKTMLRAFEDGYIVGMKDGSLEPNGVINRAQVATILNQVFKNTRSVDLSGKTDIPESVWYYSQLEKATYLGFIATTSAAIMTKSLIRQDAFVILGSAFGVTEAHPDETLLREFSDTDTISGIYRNASASFVNQQFAIGADGKLMGSKNVTRAEFLTMLYKILDNRELFDCNSTDVVLEENHDYIIHSYELDSLQCDESYGVVSLLQQSGDVYLNPVSIESLIIGPGNAETYIESGEYDKISLTGSNRKVVVSTDVPEFGVAGNNNEIIIDQDVAIDKLYIANYCKENRIVINGSVEHLYINGEDTELSGAGKVSAVSITAVNCSAKVLPTEESIIEETEININAPATLSAGDALNVSVSFNALPKAKSYGQWIVDGKPFGSRFNVDSDSSYKISPTITYTKNMDTEMNISFELLCSDGDSLESKEASTKVELQNYSDDYYRQQDIDRVNDTITSYQYEATITTNGNAYKESDLTGWLCEITKGMKVTCLTPVNTSTVKVLLPNGYKGWVSTSAIRTGSGNYTLAKDFDNSDKELWINSRNYSSSTNYLIWVSLACQKVNVFTGSCGNWKLEKVFPCASGAYSTPTPPGIYQITYKTSRWQYSGYWCGPVTGFYGGYAFHSWLNTNSGGAYDHTMGRPVSHGCLRMMDADAQYIYGLPMSTRIVIY